MKPLRNKQSKKTPLPHEGSNTLVLLGCEIKDTIKSAMRLMVKYCPYRFLSAIRVLFYSDFDALDDYVFFGSIVFVGFLGGNFIDYVHSPEDFAKDGVFAV